MNLEVAWYAEGIRGIGRVQASRYRGDDLANLEPGADEHRLDTARCAKAKHNQRVVLGAPGKAGQILR